MEHVASDDIYMKVGEKLNRLHVRAPITENLYEVLKDVFDREEAEVFVRMPYCFSGLDRVSKITKIGKRKLEPILESMAGKGLVMDFYLGGELKYMPSPLFVGIFEFTMMRMGDVPGMQTYGKHFHEYMTSGAPYFGNFDKDTQTWVARTEPHEGTTAPGLEILDYEQVGRVVETSANHAVSRCSCRYKKKLAGKEVCMDDLWTCTMFNRAADYTVRRNLARKISKSESFELFERSRERGVVFSVDNVKQGFMFICHCCGCCCGILHGMNVHGITNSVITSNFIADVDEEKCLGCGKCAKACPIDAIEMVPTPPPPDKPNKKRKRAQIDARFCLGCGVCSLKCTKTEALKLANRGKRVIHPSTTFERVILQCLDRGTLQYQILDNPQSSSQRFMRYFLGGFLRLNPVKRALMGDTLRSTFLKSMEAGVKVLGRGYLLEI